MAAMPLGHFTPARDWNGGRIPRWYVVATENASEALAAAEIRQAGFQVFLPKVRQRVPALGKRPATTVERPAFRGYLFALWSEDEPWQRIRSRRGVARILHRIGFPEVPAPMPSAFMDAMLARASMTGVLEDVSAPEREAVHTKASWVNFSALTADERVAVLRGVVAA